MITLKAFVANSKLHKPLSISFHTWDTQENVIVALEYNGVTGYGEAAPFKPITLDSQEDVIAEYARLPHMYFNPENTTPVDFHTFLDECGVIGHTTRAGLDFAFHDLKAKLAGVPVFKLYQETVHTPNNSITLFIDSPGAMQEEASKVLSTYPDLQVMKIKLRGNNDDIEAAKRIKAVVNNDSIGFIIDANQAYNSGKEALEPLRAIVSALGTVYVVEEPVTKGELGELSLVKEELGVAKVFADESAVDIEDAKKIISLQAAHGINIKLQKAGGIWQGKLIADMAKQADMDVMVGCMLEGPIAISASAHFAASTPNVQFTDLDMDFATNLYCTHRLPFINGRRSPTSVVGLGTEPSIELIENEKQLENLEWRQVV